MLWGLKCLTCVAPFQVRHWISEQQRAAFSVQDLSATGSETYAEVIWSRLGVKGSVGRNEINSPLNAELYVGSRIITLADQQPPVWWIGTAKAPHMLALILGLGGVLTADPTEALRHLEAPQLLSPAEMGYALALIAEYSGTEPKTMLKATNAEVREGYQGGKAELNRENDLRHDFQILTSEYDRAVG